LDKKNQAATRTIGFIDKQLEEITDSLSYFEGLVEAFKQQNVVTNLDGEALRLYQRIESLETNMAQMQLQRNYYEYLTDYLQKDDDLDQVVPPSSVGVEDQIMTGLIAQLVQLQTEVKLQTSNERTESQFITRKRSQIDKIRSDLLTSVRNTLEAQQINENFLQNQIKLVQAQLIKLPESERKLVNIQRNYALSENLYIFLMQKRAEAGISKAATTSDIVIVNPPRRIGGIITPKPMQNYAVGGALGFILPIVVFGLIEFLNNRIQSKEDIEAITDIPHIGGIGHNGNESNLAVHERPKSSVAESFRSLRSNLNFFTQGKEKKVVMITSSLSGEGKTFTTINLATVLAISNKKVLIVGADMRRPRLYDDFGLTNETGLSNYLANQNEFDDIIQQTQIHNLYLVSGGPVPPNPSELLMSERMTHFIETALDKFDFVILDTPPIGLVTDAFILSEFSDHTLFLVRQDYTPAPVVKNVQELYLSGKIKNVSILFNDIKKVGPGYGYGYSYNYGYKNYRYGEYYK
ncbi:MAG: polysaccharide biosynthesis tyrosine autokinase, partial [Bacteroidota bacterium]